MEKYNYKEALKQDIRNYIKDNNFTQDDETLDEYVQTLDEDLWGEDIITGNGPYGYGSEEECEQYLSGNLRLAFEALYDFGTDFGELMRHFPKDICKYLDTTIRCYLLRECIEEVVNETKS